MTNLEIQNIDKIIDHLESEIKRNDYEQSQHFVHNYDLGVERNKLVKELSRFKEAKNLPYNKQLAI